MSRCDKKYRDENKPFICENCGSGVVPAESYTRNRNHCPECLWSKHVDLRTGDRMSVCRGLMEPIGVWVKERDEWALIHRCVKCGSIRANRIAGDDDLTRLMNLAIKPVMLFPFPYAALSGDDPGQGKQGGTR